MLIVMYCRYGVCNFCSLLLLRNSDKSARPQFRETVESLSRPEDELIFIPEEVKGQAALLGAPLEAGRNLYTELQNTYIS